jgi:hypothetical protein
MDATTPSLITIPFASGSSSRNDIPATQNTSTPAAASFTGGFPAITMQSVSDGGLAPYGEDFNGILYAITAIQKWQNAGGVPKFSATQAAAIGGYPKGALLQKADGSGFWVSLVNANMTDPATDRTNWLDPVAALFGYAVDTGIANAYAAAIPGASLTDGCIVRVRIKNTNTGASTLNVSSLGAKNLVRPDGTRLEAGMLVAGAPVICQYRSTDSTWVLIGGTNYHTGVLYDAVTSATDTTTGRLLTVGFRGLGATLSLEEGGTSDLNSYLRSGFYRTGATLSNAPSTAPGYSPLLVVQAGDTVLQILGDWGYNTMYFRNGRNSGSSWSPWRQVVNEANLGGLIGLGVRYGTVGSHVLARLNTNTPTGNGYPQQPGNTYSGANLIPDNCAAAETGLSYATLAGTWQLCGFCYNADVNAASDSVSLFLRIA